MPEGFSTKLYGTFHCRFRICSCGDLVDLYFLVVATIAKGELAERHEDKGAQYNSFTQLRDRDQYSLTLVEKDCYLYSQNKRYKPFASLCTLVIYSA